MSPIEHVREALDWCVQDVFQFLPIPLTSHSHWRGVGQHSASHNQQPDQLYAKKMCYAAWSKWWSPDTDWFSDPDPYIL
jgi:hypothetical protein